MVLYGGIDMDRVYLRVFKQFVVVGISMFNAKSIPDLVHCGPRPLADGIHFRQRVFLIDRDKLGPKTQTDNGNFEFLFAHGKILDYYKLKRRFSCLPSFSKICSPRWQTHPGSAPMAARCTPHRPVLLSQA